MTNILYRNPILADDFARLMSAKLASETPLDRIYSLGSAVRIAERAWADYAGGDPETEDRLCTASAEARKAFYAACDAHFVKGRG